MSPACGYLSLFVGKRNVQLSRAVFRGRRGPARCLLAPLSSGFDCAFWFPCPLVHRARPWFGIAVFPAGAPVPRTVSSGVAACRIRGPSRLPGPARMRVAGQPANMTFMSVNGSQSRPGLRRKGADRLALYRRV